MFAKTVLLGNTICVADVIEQPQVYSRSRRSLLLQEEVSWNITLPSTTSVTF
jgi:hypothetical protein